MNALVRQGLVGTRQVTRTIAIVGADVSALALQYAGSVFTGALSIGTGHFLLGTACRGLGDAGMEIDTPDAGYTVSSSEHAA